MVSSQSLQEPANVLNRIKRGLSGYISYLAACEMNQSFSECVLYEPILRILTARDYVVECEVICPGIQQPTTGDRRRLDLVATRPGLCFAMEVKWAKQRTLNVQNDYDKLAAFLNSDLCAGGRAYLCVFGRKSDIGDLALIPDCFQERGKAVIAEFGKTRYGCRIFEISTASPSSSAN
jgi:Holliday junction resolvase